MKEINWQNNEVLTDDKINCNLFYFDLQIPVDRSFKYILVDQLDPTSNVQLGVWHILVA